MAPPSCDRQEISGEISARLQIIWTGRISTRLELRPCSAAPKVELGRKNSGLAHTVVADTRIAYRLICLSAILADRHFKQPHGSLG